MKTAPPQTAKPKAVPTAKHAKPSRVQSKRTPVADFTLDQLTLREYDVFDLLAKGMPNRDIAAKLGLSYETAREHVGNILRKMGFNSRIQVVLWAVENCDE